MITFGEISAGWDQLERQQRGYGWDCPCPPGAPGTCTACQQAGAL